MKTAVSFGIADFRVVHPWPPPEVPSRVTLSIGEKYFSGPWNLPCWNPTDSVFGVNVHYGVV